MRLKDDCDSGRITGLVIMGPRDKWTGYSGANAKRHVHKQALAGFLERLWMKKPTFGRMWVGE